MKFWAGLKEFFRKRLVNLKRKPQTLPMLAIIISMMIYTFKLGNFSNAAIYTNSFYVAICVFLITLFSILSIFTYMGSVEKKGVKPVRLALSIIMIVALIALDVACYIPLKRDAIAEAERSSLGIAVKDTIVHIVSLSITLVLILTRPFYAKLLNMINTSVENSEFDDTVDAEEVITEDE